MKESLIYHSIRILGFFIRLLPLSAALWVGRMMGVMAYYFDSRHRALAYSNIQIAFSQTRTPNQIKEITKEVFINYGQNIIELLRLPLLKSKTDFEKLVEVEGKEVVEECLKQGNGVLLLAMHFGSWEMASLISAMLGYPYKMMTKPQTRYSKLDELLNSYRECGGSAVISRGLGNREFIKSLKDNEVIGIVVDQGGKDGVLVPFFDRKASMSVGAIRMGLKWNVPVCFSIIIRKPHGRHRMIIHKPLVLENTGNQDADVAANLGKITKIMEGYILQYPSEYMWFYKIWKYSKEANILILSDGKTGHLRQSQSVAATTQKAFLAREIETRVKVVEVKFKSPLQARLFSFVSIFFNRFLCQARVGEVLGPFITKESLREMTSYKSDFIISCGSSVAGVNYFLSQNYSAKSVAILKPGLLSYKKFNVVILPQHDDLVMENDKYRVINPKAAPNLITDEYLAEQSELLLNRFSHLKTRLRPKIGLFIGGDAKNVFLTESQIKLLIDQLLQFAHEMNYELFVTTSRRTPSKIEQILKRDLKKNPLCPLLIIANEENVPEAVGGMLGLVDVAISSGDSISMVSEAASSGKNTIVFPPKVKQEASLKMNKHLKFLESMHNQNYIISADIKDINRILYEVVKNKMRTKRLDDNHLIFEAIRFAI